MAILTDEVFGPEGELVSSTTRTVVEDTPLLADLYETRKQVKAIAANTTLPIWGRVLAKFLLQLSFWMVVNRETDDTPNV
jgi:hypothetical protein